MPQRINCFADNKANAGGRRAGDAGRTCARSPRPGSQERGSARRGPQTPGGRRLRREGGGRARLPACRLARSPYPKYGQGGARRGPARPRGSPIPSTRGIQPGSGGIRLPLRAYPDVLNPFQPFRRPGTQRCNFLVRERAPPFRLSSSQGAPAPAADAAAPRLQGCLSWRRLLWVPSPAPQPPSTAGRGRRFLGRTEPSNGAKGEGEQAAFSRETNGWSETAPFAN